MAFKKETFVRGIILRPDDIGVDNIEGELKVGLTSKKLHVYLDGALRNVVTEAQIQTLTNKTIDADNNTISNLEVDNLKAGVLNTDITLAGATDQQIPSALAIKTYVDDTAAAQNEASEISFDPAGTISATNVQAMGEELDSDIQAEIVRATAAEDLIQDNLDAHINDTTDAHDASAISVVPAGNLASTDVQSALQELQTDIDSINTDIVDDVEGPASATDNALARFDGTTGKLIQNSTATLSDTGDLTISSGSLTVDNLNLNGNTITGGTSSLGIGTNMVSTTATEIHNGAIVYTPSVDNTTTGANATVNAGNNKIVILTNALLTSIDMIVSNLSGQEITLVNRTGNLITINHNTGATASYRIMTPTGAAVSFANDATFSFIFDTVDSNWTIAGGTGSGSGAQVPDVFVQLTASELITDWSTGDNATFLGGGTLAGTFAKETASPLNGTASYKYTQAAGSANDYLASPVQSVPIRFRGNQATIYFPYLYNGNNSDITVVVYDVTNATLLTDNTFNALSASGNNTSIYKANIDIPLTCTQIRVGFQTLVENSGKILQFDDIQVSSDTTLYADFTDEQSSTIISTASLGAANLTGALTETNGQGIYSYDSGTGTYTALKSAKVSISGTMAASGASTIQPQILFNGVVYNSGVSAAIASSYGSVSAELDVTVGDTWLFRNAVANTSNRQVFTITARANTEQIVSQTEVFSTDSALLQYAGSATYTLSTLANAPVGTFITFTYASSTNTRTQTTTAPTQTTSDMNLNGIQLFTRAYNAASTSGSPAAIAIQIGKNLKGVSKNLYKSSSKTTGGSLDNILQSTTVEYGITYQNYDELTGILYLDAGYANVTTNTSRVFNFSDLTTQTSGYVVINASKNPALTGVNAITPRIATLKDVKASGTGGGTFTSGSYQTRTLNTLEGDSTFITLSSNQFTLVPGFYYVEGSAPAVRVDGHKCKLRNITSSTDVLLGTSESSQNASTLPTRSYISGHVTVTSTSTFELQHRGATTFNTNGFGLPNTFGDNEVYTQLKITKIS